MPRTRRAKEQDCPTIQHISLAGWQQFHYSSTQGMSSQSIGYLSLCMAYFKPTLSKLKVVVKLASRPIVYKDVFVINEQYVLKSTQQVLLRRSCIIMIWLLLLSFAYLARGTFHLQYPYREQKSSKLKYQYCYSNSINRQ